MEVTNRYITTKTYLEGAPKESHFELKTEALNLSVQPGSNDVIVKNLYVSIDPYQINRLKIQSVSHKAISFSVAINPGEVSHHVILPYQVGEWLITKPAMFELFSAWTGY
jgi:NADPH-dependent curcumin reductase CurA